MKTIVRHFKDDLYYEVYFGSKRYWRQLGDRMYGYCQLSESLIDHMIRPLESFQFLDKHPQAKPQVLVPNPAADALECGS